MSKEYKKFVIAQKGLLFRDGKCLILKINLKEDTNFKNFGKWDLPGGRIDAAENNHLDSFKREIKEETGLDDFIDLGVIDYQIWLSEKDEYKPFCAFVRLIENDSDEIKLSSEHSETRWIGKDEIDDYQYCWDEMSRMIRRGFECYKFFKEHAEK